MPGMVAVVKLRGPVASYEPGKKPPQRILHLQVQGQGFDCFRDETVFEKRFVRINSIVHDDVGGAAGGNRRCQPFDIVDKVDFANGGSSKSKICVWGKVVNDL